MGGLHVRYLLLAPSLRAATATDFEINVVGGRGINISGPSREFD